MSISNYLEYDGDQHQNDCWEFSFILRFILTEWLIHHSHIFSELNQSNEIKQRPLNLLLSHLNDSIQNILVMPISSTIRYNILTFSLTVLMTKFVRYASQLELKVKSSQGEQKGFLSICFRK